MVFFDVNGRTFRFYQAFLKVGRALFLDRRSLRSKIVFSITTLTQVIIVLMCLIHPLANGLSVSHQHLHNDRILMTIGGVLAQIGLWVCNRSIVPLIESTIEDSSVIEEPEEQNVIERHSRPGAFIFYGLTALSIPVIGVQFIRFVLVINKSILKNSRETGECTDDEIWLILLPILSQISFVYSVHLFHFTLLFFWNTAMHLSAQYKILKKRFQNFLLIRDKKVSRKEFRWLVDRHNELLDLSRYLEDAFAFVVAFHIFNLQGILCLHTYRFFTDVHVFSLTSIIRLLICSMLAVEIATYYYAGDYLTACSEEIGEVFTQCNWYDLSKESITDFSIVIARCRKPVKLTAAKMYRLNLSNLKYVFNALYSYMTCIAAVVKATRE